MTRPLAPAAAAAEAFAAANLTFLAGDILLAHSMNAFRAWTEWIPFGFSAVAGPALAIAFWRASRQGPGWRAPALGTAIAIGAIAVGLAGFFWHLDSQFFQTVSMRSLVYTAPLAAPLAYAGLGLLLLLNRMVPTDTEDWGRWCAVLAGGGWAGNFALTLMDHAQNGFYYWTEWLGVTVSAFAVAFLALVTVRPRDATLRRATGLVLAAGAGIGLLGFGLHAWSSLTHPASRRWDAIIYGAPPFAPLLLADLAILGWIALWAVGSASRNPEPVSDS